MVSIHATHTGGDGLPDEIDARFLISIHATHTGGDRRKIAKYITASAISIHATHTGGDRLYRQPPQPLRIFQSTPPTRVATKNVAPMLQTVLFQSTPPTRVATRKIAKYITASEISIHATHTGGDGCTGNRLNHCEYFNPRHPHGWRQQKYTKSTALSL